MCGLPGHASNLLCSARLSTLHSIYSYGTVSFVAAGADVGARDGMCSCVAAVSAISDSTASEAAERLMRTPDQYRVWKACEHRQRQHSLFFVSFQCLFQFSSVRFDSAASGFSLSRLQWLRQTPTQAATEAETEADEAEAEIEAPEGGNGGGGDRGASQRPTQTEAKKERNGPPHSGMRRQAWRNISRLRD